MVDTLYSKDDGAALAANQVGILKRIIVIDYEDEYLELVNPEIIEANGEQTDNEGCLSYPGYFGQVKRYDFVKVTYQDRYGKKHVIEKKGNMARCLQHEIDHLDGILFIDRLTEDFLINNESKDKIRLAVALDNSFGKN
jgi:peptide deformylase